MLANAASVLGSPFTKSLNGNVNTSTTWTPKQLFKSSEQGVWYDPSDLTTLFQDAAGTTPCTTPGRGAAMPVGLMLDKSKNGVGTNGAARYNLLTYTEQFDNAAWVKDNVVAASDSTTAPDGSNTADKLTPNAVTASWFRARRNSASAFTSAKYSICVKANGYSQVALRESATTGSAAVFNLSNGSVSGTYNSGAITVSGASITSLGSGWYRISAVFSSASNTNQDFGFYILDGNWTSGSVEYNWTPNGTSSVYVWGADLRLTSQSALTPTYQKITSDWSSTLPGNHATQSTTAARPELSARVNLLTYTEQFQNAAWTSYLNSIVVSADSTTAPDGTTTADTATCAAINNQHNIQYASPVGTSGLNHTFSKCFKYKTNRWVGLGYWNGSSWQIATFDIQNGAVGANAASGITASISSLGDGWYRCKISVTTVSSYLIWSMFMLPSDTLTISWSAAGTEAVYLWGADLRVTNDGVGLPSYQRVVDQYTYDSAGFPYYLKADGTDDRMATPSNLDLSGTNTVTVFAGSLYSAGSVTVLAETSADAYNNNGSFLIAQFIGPPAVGKTYVRGSAINTRVFSRPTPPNKYILSAVFKATAADSASSVAARWNGVADAGTNEASNNSTGNFASQPLNILARNNSTTYPTNGRLYGLIIRGADSTAAQIANAEKWMNGKTKAY